MQKHTKFLCCSGPFDALNIRHYAESALTAVAWLESHGGGVLHNWQQGYKITIPENHSLLYRCAK